MATPDFEAWDGAVRASSAALVEPDSQAPACAEETPFETKETPFEKMTRPALAATAQPPSIGADTSTLRPINPNHTVSYNPARTQSAITSTDFPYAALQLVL